MKRLRFEGVTVTYSVKSPTWKAAGPFCFHLDRQVCMRRQCRVIIENTANRPTVESYKYFIFMFRKRDTH